jgi:hypothetical protein
LGAAGIGTAALAADIEKTRNTVTLKNRRVVEFNSFI